MNAKELADTVVALGVGRQGTAISADGVGFYYTPTDENTHEEEGLYSKLFVRDWRVAGALMEKMSGANCRHIINNISLISKNKGQLPRAIIEACVEALSE